MVIGRRGDSLRSAECHWFFRIQNSVILSMTRTSRWLILFGALLIASGCGGGDGLDRREVRGMVTVGGEPVQKGNVTLFPLGDGPVASGVITDGEYLIEEENGPIPGEYRVEIIGTEETGETKVIKMPGIEPRTVRTTVSVVPMKYNEQSELTMTVGEGEEVVEKDFELDGE